jgi:hypothetical protein
MAMMFWNIHINFVFYLSNNLVLLFYDEPVFFFDDGYFVLEDDFILRKLKGKNEKIKCFTCFFVVITEV